MPRDAKPAGRIRVTLTDEPWRMRVLIIFTWVAVVIAMFLLMLIAIPWWILM